MNDLPAIINRPCSTQAFSLPTFSCEGIKRGFAERRQRIACATASSTAARRRPCTQQLVRAIPSHRLLVGPLRCRSGVGGEPVELACPPRQAKERASRRSATLADGTPSSTLFLTSSPRLRHFLAELITIMTRSIGQLSASSLLWPRVERGSEADARMRELTTSYKDEVCRSAL